MLDGLNIINPRNKHHKLIDKAVELGQTAMAITDHGAMYGCLHFYNACRKAGIKPIIGVEAYVARHSRLDKQTKMGGDQFHLTLLAENNTGYQNLMYLTSMAHIEGFSYRPRIDLDLLFEYSEGVIATSGCMSSLFNKLLLEGKDEEALELFKKFKEVFQDRFYVELQRHPNIPEQAELNDTLITIARQLDIPLVATNDVHYLEPADADAQDAIICVQTRKLIADEKRMKMSSPDFYLKSTAEMVELFHDYPEAIENTVKIAQRCNVEIHTGQLIFPKFEIPEGYTNDTYFIKMTTDALKKKFPDTWQDLEERLQYEMDIIIEKGYSAYFLITQDFVNWAKQQGIGVGPGRGSVAGSLVAYCLNITTINPLNHNLPFERFLNPERPTPPDIDMDFADSRRDEVLEYCSRKYGHDHVAHVITFGRMEARVAIRDIGRVLGMPYEEPDKIAKLIPSDPGKKTSLQQALDTVPELAEYYKQPKYKKLIDLAKRVEGLARHSSVHAAAVIIADKPLHNYTPIQKDSKSGEMVTQYDMYALDCNVDDDAIGLLKFDFLGLRNLTTIQTAVNLIKQTKNLELDIASVPLDDKKTYEMLSQGNTVGVFQLESAGMRRVAKTLQPSQFSDITALVALYRPGPMELIPQFIEGKHNPEQIKYLHPNLKQIFEETYGVMVYQEQVMQVFSLMAGYSLGEADMIRRAMGKKKVKILEENRLRFIQESEKNGYSKEVSEKVWSYIMAFANYGFNKAHAASYAMISYETAYLKANYPVEYMCALMSVESAARSANSEEKVSYAIETAKQMGIMVLPPDINLSDADFTIEKNKDSLDKLAIRFGLSAIKNVGEAAIENILQTRHQEKKFTSLSHFIYSTDSRKVNKKVLECLIKVGAMDEFGTRAAMLENLEAIKKRVLQFDSGVDGQDNLFSHLETVVTDLTDNFPNIAEYPFQELLSFEKELLGLYLTDHPLGKALKNVADRATKTIADIDLELNKDQLFLFGGVINKFRQVQTKKGQTMAFGTLVDQTGSIDFVVFPRLYEEFNGKLQDDMVILLKGKVDERDGEAQLIADKIIIPDDVILEAIPEDEKHEIFIPRKTAPDTLQKLGKLLKAHPGKDRVVIMIPNGSQPKKMLLPYGVAWTQDLAVEVEALLN